MSFGIDELSRRILNGSLTSGGWPSMSEKANASLTVTSEMILALTEFLEYSKNPASETERATREEATQKIEKALEIVLSDLTKRIDAPDLSIWHFSMTLAATANARAFFLREGKPPAKLDSLLFQRILEKIDNLKDHLSDDLGIRWAYLRAIELITRTEHAPNKDQDLWEIIANDVKNFSKSAATIRNNILRSGIEDKTPYEIAIIADICVDTLKNSSNPAEYSRAKEVLLNAIRKIQESIGYESETSMAFPIYKFLPDGTDPKYQDTNQYRVVTTATLASTFSFVIREKILASSCEALEMYANFYSIVHSLHTQIHQGMLWGYGPAHCLRTLAEIQINKRDSDAALEILRLAQKERRTSNEEKNKRLAHDKSLRDQYESCFLIFGQPESKYFAMCSPRMSLVLFFLFVFLTVIMWINSDLIKNRTEFFIFIPLLIAFFLLLWGIYATRIEDYKKAGATQRVAITLVFLLSLWGIIGSGASIFGLSLAQLLPKSSHTSVQQTGEKND